MAAYSIVEYLSDHDGYRCGYCGSKDTNYSHGTYVKTRDSKDSVGFCFR